MMLVCSLTLAAKRVVAAGRRLVDDDRQRRLERMGEVADMGAGALDDLAVGLEQRVGLARQRRDLDRKVALQPLGACPRGWRRAISEMRLSGARPKRTWNIVMKISTERERAEGEDQRLVEGPDLVVDLLAGRRRRRPGSGRPRRDRRCARRCAAAGPRALSRSRAGCRRRRPAPSASSSTGRLLSHNEREARTSRLRRAEPGDLPVPARQRQLEQRLAERRLGAIADCSGATTSATSVRR